MGPVAVLRRARRRETSPVIWLLTGQLIMFTGVSAVFPVAPLYVAHRGGNSVAVAIFIAGPMIANTLMQLPAGRLCDRYGRRPFLLGSRLITGVLSLLLFLDVGPLWLLIAIRIVSGAASGAYVPALRAALTDLSTADNRAQRFAQLQAFEMVGLLVGPLIGGAAALWRDSAVFGITGVAMFIGLGPMLRVPETRARALQEHERRANFQWWRTRGVVVPALALMAVGTIWSMYDVVWPQYLTVRGNGTLVIGLSVSLFALPILLLAKAGGRLADRASPRRLVPSALLLVGACAASYPFLRPLAVILAVGTVEAIATVILEPSLFAVIGDSAPERARGHAMGVGGLSQFAGMAFGSGVLGSLYGFGEGLPFWVGAGVLAAAALLCATALPERTSAGARAEPPPTLPLREREAV